MAKITKKKKFENRLQRLLIFIILLCIGCFVLLIYMDRHFRLRDLKNNNPPQKVGTYSDDQKKDYPDPWDLR